MANLKISEYPVEITNLSESDLMDVSRDIGAGLYETVKIQAKNGALYEVFAFAASDPDSDLVEGELDRFHWPFDFTLVSMFIGVKNPPTDSSLIADLHDDAGVSIFSIRPSIDSGEDTSLTAVTPPTITTTLFSKGDKLTPFLDQKGATNAGSGLKFYLIGNRR